jgi:hypothetical protein
MNYDLQLRLTKLDDLDSEEYAFGQFVIDGLVPLAAPGCICVEIIMDEIENGEDDTAYVETDDDLEFRVYLDNRMPFGMVVDYLLHELAHIASWPFQEDDDHGDEWGKAHAMLYRRYLELYEEYWEE